MKKPICLVSMMLFLLAGACGGSEDPGTGSRTLKVICSIDARQQVSNSGVANDYDVSFRVIVTRNGLPVGDARVTITPDGEEPFVLSGNDVIKGIYLASRVGYRFSYSLDVEAGADFVHDARLQGPDIHTFESPLSGSVVPASADLEIRWNRKLQADSATLNSRRLKNLQVSDIGSFMMDSSFLPAKPDRQEEDFITLLRTRRVGLEGGLEGSEMSITVGNRVEFLVDVLQ